MEIKRLPTLAVEIFKNFDLEASKKKRLSMTQTQNPSLNKCDQVRKMTCLT